MTESSEDDYDCWEWFQEDKDNILRSLTRKTATGGRQVQLSRRYRYCNRVKTPATTKISNERLLEIFNLQPLGLFLYLFTETDLSFFDDQISPNDDMERVIIYTRILVTLCEMEMPGFHNDLMHKVASCTTLFKHYEEIVRKLVTKSFRTMWTDMKRVDNIIYYMQTLLMKAQRAEALDKNGIEILFNIWLYLKNNQNPTIEERPRCVEFLKQLREVFGVEQNILNELNPGEEIFLNLEELHLWLQQTDDDFDCSSMVKLTYTSTTEYINNQRSFLRQQFLLPLREMIRTIHLTNSTKDIKLNNLAFENVQIKLNKEFCDTHNTKLICIDIWPLKRLTTNEHNFENNSDIESLLKLKNGALLCLTTGYDFPNLILAVVTGTNVKKLRQGYIAVNIVQQFKIGNIYDQMLIMFETPAYFEPYYAPYRYLKNTNTLNFPMADYIVHGVTRTKAPDYLRNTQPPNVYKSQKFINKVRQMPLNHSQSEAFQSALNTNFTLIQGPPGTGKTHLSLQLVKTIVENAKFCAPVVVITYTNDSLDKFLLKLSAFTKNIVRFGCQSRLPEIAKFNARADNNLHMINPRLKRLYWMVNLEIKEHLNRLQMLYAAFNHTDSATEEIREAQRLVWNAQEKLNCIRMIFQHYLILKKDVLAMTSTCAARMNFVFRFLKSRIVIFEEAAEILESHVLPCLTPYTEHVIMVGDHLQLKPYTSFAKGYNWSTVPQSLFERLIRVKFNVNILNIQYRMRNVFADLLCPLIYEKLLSHESVYEFPSIRNMSMNLYFLNHQEPESKIQDGLVCNPWETEKVTELLSYLVEVCGYTSKDVVVLSPYSKQVTSIKNKMSKISHLKDVHIATVDSFQGLEANIVVLSLVRSNKKASIGFLCEKCRICVAMSRARYGLFMIGNMWTLAHKSPIWREIQKKFNHINAIGAEFPYEKK